MGGLSLGSLGGEHHADPEKVLQLGLEVSLLRGLVMTDFLTGSEEQHRLLYGLIDA